MATYVYEKYNDYTSIDGEIVHFDPVSWAQQALPNLVNDFTLVRATDWYYRQLITTEKNKVWSGEWLMDYSNNSDLNPNFQGYLLFADTFFSGMNINYAPEGYVFNEFSIFCGKKLSLVDFTIEELQQDWIDWLPTSFTDDQIKNYFDVIAQYNTISDPNLVRHNWTLISTTP
jgi:hypothetical protein